MDQLPYVIDVPRIVTPKTRAGWARLLDYLVQTAAVVVIEIDENGFEEMLARNPVNNRAIRKGRITLYSGRISARKWRLNGEAIIFDWDGNLANGQHRLLGGRRARKPFVSYVIFGIDPDAYDTMDGPGVRTGQDTLKRHDLAKDRNTAAIARFDISLNAGNTTFNEIVPNEDLRLHVEANPDIIDASMRGRDWNRVFRPIKVAAWGFFYLRTSRIDPDLALSFCEQIATGVGLSSDHPAMTVRRYFVNAAADAGRRPIIIELAVLWKAWNAVRLGKRPNNFVFRTRGGVKETFPEMV